MSHSHDFPNFIGNPILFKGLSLTKTTRYKSIEIRDIHKHIPIHKSESLTFVLI